VSYDESIDDFHDQAIESGSDFDDDLVSGNRKGGKSSRDSNRKVIPLE
jgi:hypothetical protein